MIDQQIIEECQKMLLVQNMERIMEITTTVIESGADPLEFLNMALIPGITEVGKQFSIGRLFLPELMHASNVMHAATDIVNDALTQTGMANGTKNINVLIATVKGDVHDIGKCIVVSLMKANGFNVHDLGRDVDVDTIIEKATEFNVDVIGTSALLTTTMDQQKRLENALKSAGLKDRFLTVVGGAPVTARWAARIGADVYAEDAQDGIVKITELLSQK